MSGSWSDRLEHLRTRHSFGYGNDGHIHAFHEVDEFKAHLIAYHRAILEPWTVDSEQFCKDNKSTPGAISGEPKVICEPCNTTDKHAPRRRHPRNPFVGPRPMSQHSNNSNYSMIDNPVSDLPRESLANQSLPRPSSFPPKVIGALPLSPFRFPTPLSSSSSFMMEDSQETAGEKEESQSTLGDCVSDGDTVQPQAAQTDDT